MKQETKKVEYVKIAKFRKMKPSGKLGAFKSHGTTTLVAFPRENGITFSFRFFNSYTSMFNHAARFCLSVRKRKDGSHSFNFYNLAVGAVPRGRSAIQSANPYRLKNEIEKWLAFSGTRNATKIPGAWVLRLRKLLKQLLKRNEISMKYLPKDPFQMMLLLCYPGYELLSSAVYPGLPCRKEAKGNLTKALLRTNGAYSKKLLKFACDGRQPTSAILSAVKLVRRFYSLDSAQQFLFKIASQERYVMDMGFSGLGSFIKDPKFVSQFKHWRPERFFDLFCYSLLEQNPLMDCLRMLDRATQRHYTLPDFSATRNVDDLHAALIAAMSATKNKQRLEPKYYFSCRIELTGFVKAAKEVKPEWEIKFPCSTIELSTWGSHAGNCISAYEREIAAGKINIIQIEKDGKYLYSAGLSFPNDLNFLTHLYEVASRFNGPVTEEDIEAIKVICAMSGVNCDQTNWHQKVPRPLVGAI